MDEVIREITHGIWCLLSMFVAGMCAWHVFSNFERPWGLGTRAAVSIGICMGGAGLRGIWLWGLAFYQARDWNVDLFNNSLSIFYVTVSTLIAIVGALCAVRVFSPNNHGWLWITVCLFCVAIPIILHLSI